MLVYLPLLNAEIIIRTPMSNSAIGAIAIKGLGPAFRKVGGICKVGSIVLQATYYNFIVSVAGFNRTGIELPGVIPVVHQLPAYHRRKDVIGFHQPAVSA